MTANSTDGQEVISQFYLFPLFISFTAIYGLLSILSIVALAKHFYFDRNWKHIHVLYAFLSLFLIERSVQCLVFVVIYKLQNIINSTALTYLMMIFTCLAIIGFAPYFSAYTLVVFRWYELVRMAFDSDYQQGFAIVVGGGGGGGGAGLVHSIGASPGGIGPVGLGGGSSVGANGRFMRSSLFATFTSAKWFLWVNSVIYIILLLDGGLSFVPDGTNRVSRTLTMTIIASVSLVISVAVFYYGCKVVRISKRPWTIKNPDYLVHSQTISPGTIKLMLVLTLILSALLWMHAITEIVFIVILDYSIFSIRVCFWVFYEVAGSFILIVVFWKERNPFLSGNGAFRSISSSGISKGIGSGILSQSTPNRKPIFYSPAPKRSNVAVFEPSTRGSDSPQPVFSQQNYYDSDSSTGNYNNIYYSTTSPASQRYQTQSGGGVGGGPGANTDRSPTKGFSQDPNYPVSENYYSSS